MLFPYIYVSHQMEKMQEFIDFIFEDVWCQAPDGPDFDLDLFDGNQDLKEVMTAFYYGDSDAGDLFYRRVEKLYDCFANFSPEQIAQIKQWYKSNNDIEEICNDTKNQIVRYAEIKIFNEKFCELLGDFFKNIYSQAFLKLKALRNKIGNINDHYKLFVTTNSLGKCPFCGIENMLGIYHSKREAYDHYLPKTLYPFNSINFKNLVPACHHCNSTYKLSKDPAFKPKDPLKNRRKIFYPYTTVSYNINITVNIKNTDIKSLEPNEIDLNFGPESLNEHIDTWKEIYGIEERYKAKFCSSEGKYWLTQMLEEWRDDGRPTEDYMRSLARRTNNHPFVDNNFLKKAFLDGCKNGGLIRMGNL